MRAIDVRYTDETFVGGSIFVEATIRNRGDRRSDPVRMQFGGLSDHAEIIGCTPACDTSEFFGDYYAEFRRGIAGGRRVVYEIEFLATDVGVVEWTLSMYDGEFGESFFFGEGRTVIR